jgi:G3E family GTPase
MKIHLVGGFNESGKTTAVSRACRILDERNIKSSAIKEDGCDYNRLASQIELLKASSDPSIVFVEYGGTCTGLSASLLKPLRESGVAEIEASNVSTFADAQLLLPYLRGTDIPLSAGDKTIWEKLIKEAEILVISKIDRLSDCQFEAVKVLANDYFPSKKVILTDASDKDTIGEWLEIIESAEDRKAENEDIKEGEKDAGTARLDEEIEITTADDSAVEIVCGFMTALSKSIAERKLNAEHFHFFLSYNGHSSTISHTALSDTNVAWTPPAEKSKLVNVVINANVSTSPGELRKILIERLNELKCREGVTVKEKFVSIYPGNK